MFPNLIEILFYLAACVIVVFIYAPYAIYLVLKRKRQFKAHGVCLGIYLCGLLSLYVWEQTRPSDTYTILEVVNPSQKGSVIFLHEAAFQDPQTHLCVRDYSRSGNQMIHIGIINIEDGQGIHYEGAT